MAFVDPLLRLSNIKSETPLPLVPWYYAPDNAGIRLPNVTSGDGLLPPVYVDNAALTAMYAQQTQATEVLPKETGVHFDDARRRAGVFELVDTGEYGNRAALKLSNIDVVFNLLGQTFSMLQPTSNTPMTFVDLAAAPGSWSQYLQSRYTASIGYGISLRSSDPNFNWQKSNLLLDRYTIYDEEDGNLLQKYDMFSERVLEDYSGGVQVVVGDGGVETKDYAGEEDAIMPLLVAEIYVAIKVGQLGSTCALKVKHTFTQLSAQLLTLLSLNYREVILFKPVTSRVANAERYIVCRDKYNTVGLDILDAALAVYNRGEVVTSLFDDVLDPALVTWLTASNNKAVAFQAAALTNIIKALRDKTYTAHTYTTFDPYRVVNYLNMPPVARQ